MKTLGLLAVIYFVLTFTATISYSLEEYFVDSSNYAVRHRIVKRKGGRGGGGRSRGSSKSSSRSRPKSDPYPKQPPYNPSYNPSAGNSYPKQPGMNPGQTGHNNPGQAGHNYPGQTGHNYPGQTGHGYPGQTGYNQPNYGQTGLGGNTYKQKSKSGLGSALGAGALGGLGGAALGAYGGYKLGKMVGGMGRMGHYGYMDHDRGYVRCDPPPKIETDPETNITYIPKTVTYDARCNYYDRDPREHPEYNQYYRRQSGWGINSEAHTSPSSLTTIVAMVLVLVFGFNNDLRNRFDFRPQLYLT